MYYRIAQMTGPEKYANVLCFIGPRFNNMNDVINYKWTIPFNQKSYSVIKFTNKGLCSEIISYFMR